MFSHPDPAAAAGWVPWPRGQRVAAVCRWYRHTTFCTDKDGGASLMSFPPPRSFLSPSDSTQDFHTWARYIPAALAKPLVCCCTLTVTKSPEVSKQQSKAWAHGQKGRKFFGLISFMAHTTPALPAWLGRGIQFSHHIQHGSPNPALLPATTRLPGFPLFTTL